MAAKNRKRKPSKQPKSHDEKNDIVPSILVIPENLLSKRGKILWLLENLGKHLTRISCSKALEKLGIENTPNNRRQFYNYKSEFKASHEKKDRGLKPPKVTFHNFNESSIFLTSSFSQRIQSQAVEAGWTETDATNGMLMWKEKRGWLKFFPSTGRVQLHCRKPVHDGKILQLLANGFFNTNLIKDMKEFMAFFSSFYLKDVKLTAHLGKNAKIPKFIIEFDNGINKLIVMSDRSHPNGVEIQYYLSKDGEQFRSYLRDSQRSLDFATETNLQLMEVLKDFVRPKTLRDDRAKEMVI